MHNFENTVAMSRRTLAFLGVAILNPKWRYWRFYLFIVLLSYPIVNGAIMAMIAIRMGNEKLYSTCIYVMFPNTMVLVKLLIMVTEGGAFNVVMNWVQRCFETKYGVRAVDEIWTEISEQCTKTTILVTR